MTDWTPERLDALPEGTVIGATWRGGVESLLCLEHEEPESIWAEVGCGDFETSGRVLQQAVSIRVVSVPIDALLSDEALEAAFEGAYVPGGFGAWDGRRALRAAIAHVTGGAGQ